MVYFKEYIKTLKYKSVAVNFHIASFSREVPESKKNFAFGVFSSHFFAD